MPTQAQLRTRINTYAQNLWVNILPRQEAYFLAHGRYWQGRRTPRQVPQFTDAQDSPRTADRLDEIAGSEAQSWRQFLPAIDGAVLSAQIQIDTYDGPQGKGFVVHMRFNHNGNTFERSQHYGPETHRQKAWARVED